MAIHLPSDVIVHVLIPLIVTGEFPVNQSSIKMLTKLVEHHGPSSIEPRLSDLMPGIMKVRFLFHMLKLQLNTLP